MAVFLTEVGDVGAARVEDPQSEQAQHRDQRRRDAVDGWYSRTSWSRRT
ncbi:hypothetical protein [Actinoplanes xinjiangensis]